VIDGDYTDLDAQVHMFINAYSRPLCRDDSMDLKGKPMTTSAMSTSMLASIDTGLHARFTAARPSVPERLAAGKALRQQLARRHHGAFALVGEGLSSPNATTCSRPGERLGQCHVDCDWTLCPLSRRARG
jgi:hypothetical protein